MADHLISRRLQNKVALVTGAASGIGRATAILFAREGATIIAADVNDAGAAETVSRILGEDGKASHHHLDITCEDQWISLIQHIQQNHGHLDVLVNSAGISWAKAVTEMTLDEWHKVLAVNLDSVFLGTKHGLLLMQRAGEGSIINLSSASGIKASPGASAYCSSKAALDMFSRVAALESAQLGHNIRINSVSPGGVMTPMWENMGFWQDLKSSSGSDEASWKAISEGVPLKRFASPEEIAQAILYLASDDSRFVTATNLIIDGGYSA